MKTFAQILFSGIIAISPALSDESAKKVIAKVDDHLITLNQLNQKVRIVLDDFQAKHPENLNALKRQVPQIKSSVLEHLIDEKVILSQFEDQPDIVSNQEVAEEITGMIERDFKGEEELFKKHLEENGLSRDQFKKQQHQELLVKAVRRRELAKVAAPDEAKLRKGYERWKIIQRGRTKDKATYRRIYIRKKEDDDGDASLTKARKIIAQIKEGKDFADLAKTHSDDRRAESGGLWEDVLRIDLSVEFGNLIFETEANQVIGPLEDGFGFNIIQVIKRDLGPSKSFEEAREEVKKWVMEEDQITHYRKWMDNLRTKCVIKKML